MRKQKMLIDLNNTYLYTVLCGRMLYKNLKYYIREEANFKIIKIMVKM